MGLFEQFPYTNFHELNLDWFVTEFRKLLREWAEVETEFADLKEAWESLKNFVTDYFDNLDVSEEINAKIDSMVDSGEFVTIITPTLQSVSALEVAQWLEDHITQPSTPVVDDSLKVKGAAADAQMAGDAAYTSIIYNMYDFENPEYQLFPDLLNGSVNTGTGNVEYAAERVTSEYIHTAKRDIYLNVPAGWLQRSWIAYYDGGGSYTGYQMLRDDILIPRGSRFRPIFANDADSAIDVHDVQGFNFDSDKYYQTLINNANAAAGPNGFGSAFFNLDRLNNMRIGSLLTDGTINPTPERMTSIDKIRFPVDVVVAATPYWSYRSWVAFYTSGSAAYDSYEYLRQPVFIPANTDFRIVLGNQDETYVALPDIIDAIYFLNGTYHIGTELKVCSFNVGLWYDGSSQGFPDSQAAAYKKRWYEILGNRDPDIIIMQEALVSCNRSATINAYNYLLAHKYPYVYRPASGGFYATISMIVSKIPLYNMKTLTFASGSGRPWITFDASIYGTTVSIAGTHLSAETNLTGERQLDIAELAAWAQTKDHVIIAGDFNTYDISEFSPFTAAGLELANGGVFGEFRTWPHESPAWPNPAIDNIITSEPLQLVTMGEIGDAMPPDPISDHCPLYAILRIQAPAGGLDTAPQNIGILS